jgi:hypothetical protein
MDTLFFFEAGNSADLARKMMTVLGMDVVRPSQETLLLRGQKQAECLGDALMAAIDFTLKARPGGSKVVRSAVSGVSAVASCD